MSNHEHHWRPRPYISPREQPRAPIFEDGFPFHTTSPPRTRVSTPARTRASTPAPTPALSAPSARHQLINRRQEVDYGFEQDPRVLHHLLKTMSVPLNELNYPLCPICQDPYVEHIPNAPPSTYGTREYPVRICSLYPYTQCRCVFGINCIRRIFQGRESWWDRCPLCREYWFPTYEEIGAMIAARTAGGAVQDVDTPGLRGEGMQSPSVQLTRQRSRVRIHEAPEVVAAHSSPQALDLSGSRRSSLAPGQMPVLGLSNRGRVYRTAGFLERMVAEFDVDDRDGEATNMIAAIEIVAEDLWQRLETIRSMRNEMRRRSAGSPGLELRQGQVRAQHESRHR